MNAQSKIACTLLIGLALGAAVVALLLSVEQEEIDELVSNANGRSAAHAADEWSDLNDSLGG